MKHAFSNGMECLHAYANQRMENDHGYAGNISFRGDVAYSYGHYAIGHIVDRKRRRMLVQENHYSTTTAGHIYNMRQACNHYEQLAVPYPSGQHKRNVKYFHYQYTTAMEKGKRQLYYTDQYRAAITAIVNVRRYCAWFRCKSKLSATMRRFHDINVNTIQQLITEKEREIEPRREHKAAALRVKHAVVYGRWQQALAEKLPKWRQGENIRLPYRPYELRGIGKQTTYLRLNGDHTRVETSMNAQVLTVHAKALWHIVHQSYIDQATITAFDPPIILDHYQVREICNGNLTVGCHYIEYGELKSIAVMLGISA